jgi:hypothetical protein
VRARSWSASSTASTLPKQPAVTAVDSSPRPFSSSGPSRDTPVSRTSSSTFAWTTTNFHRELFGRTPRSQWIEVDDELRAEMTTRLAGLGYETLEEWAGVENLEERLGEPGVIDPVVLERLRASS